MEFHEVPENQLTIFDMLQEAQEPQEPAAETFSIDKANWHQEKHWMKLMPGEWVCGVVGIIPENVLSPAERGISNGSPQADWIKGVEVWSNYAYSISQLIPYHERGEEDANGWSVACEMLKEARDEKKPIELAIWKRFAESFEELEVVEYLQKKKTEDEVNAIHS